MGISRSSSKSNMADLIKSPAFFMLTLLSFYPRIESHFNTDVIKINAGGLSVLRDDRNGIHIANFQKTAQDKFSSLSDLPTKLLQVKTSGDCLYKCTTNQKCVSAIFSIFTNHNREHYCWLFTEESTQVHYSYSYKDSSMAKYYKFFTLKNKCLQEPCKNNGVCVPFYANNSFTCTKCLKCFSGQRCEVQGNLTALGMEDGRITRTSASSIYNQSLCSSAARLRVAEGWAALTLSVGQYLWVDLGRTTTILAVATQGRRTIYPVQQYVKSYTLKYSNANIYYYEYMVDGVNKVFKGNNDGNTVVTNYLTVPISARYVRFVVQSWHNHIVMRVELYSCKLE